MSLCIAVNTIFEIKFPSSFSIFTSHTDVLFPMWLGKQLHIRFPQSRFLYGLQLSLDPQLFFYLITVRYAAQLAVLSAKTHEAPP